MIVEYYLPDAHCFADDTQLYLSFKPLGNTAQTDAIQAIEKCIDAVRKWMIQDRLMIKSFCWSAHDNSLINSIRVPLLWAIIVSVQAHVLKTLDRGLTAT